MSRAGLRRSDVDRVLAGVFGGLGEYLGISPTILRVVGVVLLVIAPLPMILLYIAAALLIPRSGGRPALAAIEPPTLAGIVVGLVILIVGLSFFGPASVSPFLGSRFLAGIVAAIISILALILVIIGLALLAGLLRRV